MHCKSLARFNYEYLRRVKSAKIAIDNDECLVYNHTNMKTQVVMMKAIMTINVPRHQQQCNGQFQLTTLMGRSLLVNVFASNVQNVMQNVLSIATNSSIEERKNQEYTIC